MSEIEQNAQEFENTIREMSHQLRTPLTSIMGFSELLLEDDTIIGQQREYLTLISDESRRLSSMLNLYLSMLLVESDEAVQDGPLNAGVEPPV